MSGKPFSGKTLIFCTSYAGAADRPWESWDIRYRRWLDAVASSRLRHDQILIVDDGSPTLPQWPGIPVLFHLPTEQPVAPIVVYHFVQNLGRPGVYDYPGWFRSFTFAATYAQTYGFSRIVHLESDAFLISSRIQEYVNGINDDWVTFLGPRHQYPEAGIQIMAGKGLKLYYEKAALPYTEFAGNPIELMLPFTKIEHRFIGDRFGEYLSYVPAEADWTMQTYVPNAGFDDYYWWMSRRSSRKEDTMYTKVVTELRHSGLDYLEFLGLLSRRLSSRTYLEIGTDIGNSVLSVRCDCVCIDPHFKVERGIMSGRRQAHLFQMTSDDFFDHYDLRSYLPAGIDLGFLDGLHHFEALLRDFINAERYSHGRSVLLLHDCLPVNERMAEREFRLDETEDESTRHGWTGDVWRLLPVLKRFRPDLRVQVFDCGPTGLVACTLTDRYSTTLQENYQTIVDEFSRLSLSEFGMERLWSLFPTIDTRELVGHPQDIPSVLFD